MGERSNQVEKEGSSTEIRVYTLETRSEKAAWNLGWELDLEMPAGI